MRKIHNESQQLFGTSISAPHTTKEEDHSFPNPNPILNPNPNPNQEGHCADLVLHALQNIEATLQESVSFG